jgi:hypothetical protein
MSIPANRLPSPGVSADPIPVGALAQWLDPVPPEMTVLAVAAHRRGRQADR